MKAFLPLPLQSVFPDKTRHPILALRQPLLAAGTYSLNLPSEYSQPNGFPFVNLFEHTNLVSSNHYCGDHLVYCVDYVAADHAYFRLSDAQLSERFTGALPRLNPDFAADWIRESWVFRAAAAQPIPELDAGSNIASIRTPLPGLYWIHLSQMHPWGKGTTFAVRLGKCAADLILRDFRPAPA